MSPNKVVASLEVASNTRKLPTALLDVKISSAIKSKVKSKLKWAHCEKQLKAGGDTAVQ